MTVNQEHRYRREVKRGLFLRSPRQFLILPPLSGDSSLLTLHHLRIDAAADFNIFDGRPELFVYLFIELVTARALGLRSLLEVRV